MAYAASSQNKVVSHINLFIKDIETSIVPEQLTIWGIVVDIKTPDPSSKRPQRITIDDGTGVQELVNWSIDDTIGLDH